MEKTRIKAAIKTLETLVNAAEAVKFAADEVADAKRVLKRAEAKFKVSFFKPDDSAPESVDQFIKYYG